MGALMAGAVGLMVPPDLKFKADFYEMNLLCDNEPITPIRRGKSEINAPLPSYYKVKNRYTYAGFYAYPIEAFDPARCKQLTLNILSEEMPTRAERKILETRMRERVWADFEAYRQRSNNAKDATELPRKP